MGTLKVTIPDDLEKEFREEIFKSKGMKKGNISKAVEEAIRLWIEHQRKKRSKAAKKAWETRRKKQSSGRISEDK
jgi:metal-responsive CopG/Arc/MetJ family transcriptional regulator